MTRDEVTEEYFVSIVHPGLSICFAFTSALRGILGGTLSLPRSLHYHPEDCYDATFGVEDKMNLEVAKTLSQ